MSAIPSDLAPESRAIMRRARELGLLDAAAETIEERRRLSVLERPLRAHPPEVHRVGDIDLDGPAGPLRVRVYRAAPAPPRATVLFLHGGGWVLGDLDQADIDCRCLCLDSGALVLSVNYRLAPEHPYPAALEDAYAALVWAGEHVRELGGDPRRLVVAGDSAGGNLAAALALLAVERDGPPLAHQVLIYPVTDHAFDTESYERFAEGYWLSRDDMRWMWSCYLARPEQAGERFASVLRAPQLGGLPPAFIVTAGCDVLRDEGEAYGRRLRAAGVPTVVRRFGGQIHGFWSCGAVSPTGREVNAEIAAALGSSTL